MKFVLKHLNITVLFSLFLYILGSCTLVEASEVRQAEYQPPKGRNQHPTQTRKAGGSRREDSCNLPISNNTVTLLVPQDHVPTTVSEHPTFLWFVPEQLNFPIRFTLLEPGKPPIFVKTIDKPQSGINLLTLPKAIPSLEIGKTYRWTVTIVCSDNIPSKNLYARGWLKRVATSRSNYTAIDYAREGIWYDALLTSYRQDKNSENSVFWNLLRQVNLDYLKQELYAIESNSDKSF